MLKRDPVEVESNPSVTRVGEVFPIENFYISLLPTHPTMAALLELDGEEEISYTASDAFESLEAAIGMLISAREGHSVVLNNTEKHALTSFEWSVS